MQETTQSPSVGYQLLVRLGAPQKLLHHAQLVDEAALLLIKHLRTLGVSLNTSLIRDGVALHDVGKILHPEELFGPGNKHEETGQRLLLQQGIAPDIARCCLSHAQWHTLPCSLEELVIALADTLWKGKRNPHLEQLVTEQVAVLLGKEIWDSFMDLDPCFEEIAAQGTERVLRS